MPIYLGGLKLLSIDEIRAAFEGPRKPSAETIRRYIRTKQLPGKKVGTGWYVSTRALERFLEGCPAEPDLPPEQPATPEALII